MHRSNLAFQQGGQVGHERFRLDDMPLVTLPEAATLFAKFAPPA